MEPRRSALPQCSCSRSQELRAKTNLALVLHQSGSNHRAIPLFEQVLQQEPDFLPAHNGLGMINMAQGNRAAAEHHFRRATQLDPGSPHSWLNLSLAVGSCGELEQAREHCLRALAKDPNFGEAARLLQEIEAKMAE